MFETTKSKACARTGIRALVEFFLYYRALGQAPNNQSKRRLHLHVASSTQSRALSGKSLENLQNVRGFLPFQYKKNLWP